MKKRNNIKKVIFALCLTMVLQILLLNINEVKAVLKDDKMLIKSNIINISKDTTISQINKVYSHEANIITPTPHGGHAYTWYKDGYTDLIFVETNENEEIVSAGICANDFESTLCSYGDKKLTKDEYMQGAIIDRRQNGIEGCIVYNKDKVNSKKYIEEYMKSPNSYDKYLCKHSIAIVNQYLINRGAVEAVFDEELYDKVQRIEDSSIDIREYVKLNNKDGKYIETQRDSGYDSLYEALPNPIRLAATAHRFNSSEECKYLYMRYNINDSKGSADGASIHSIYLSKNVFTNDKEVELTSEEKEKYNNAEQIYKDSLEIFNDGNKNIFKINCNYKSLPLLAGEIYENKLVGATMYLNTIRAGAGLPNLEHDNNLSIYAQHKAVLTEYMSLNNISNLDPHNPKKPDGVDDEFYNKAMSGMSGENLYIGSIITSISKALNDGQGDAIRCGHRYNLLNPTYKYFGIGNVEEQSCHKFSGYQEWNGEAVAWPSVGVTPIEAYSDGYWSCKLYKGEATNNTTVDVIRLNDNQKWSFTEKTTYGTNRLYVNSNYISFYNSSLSAKDGYVYQITIHNINKEDGTIGDYTYRTAFKSLENNKSSIEYPNFVNINKENSVMNINTKQQLIPSFSEGSTEIVTNWSSSNENVATVSQYGVITAKNCGETIVKVETLNGKIATCKIKVIDGIELEESSVMLFLDNTKKVNVYVPDDVTLTWKSSDTKVATVDNNGNITAKKLGKATITVTTSNNKKIIFEVNVVKYQKGDLDKNNIVNANDAAIALDLYKYGNVSAEELQIGDMDNNGIINANDAALILDIYKYGN